MPNLDDHTHSLGIVDRIQHARVALALFPFGFSAGYLLGWRWPLLAGCLSLACMATSLVVIGRVFDLASYLTWGVLSVPGVLYVIAGLKLRKP